MAYELKSEFFMAAWLIGFGLPDRLDWLRPILGIANPELLD